ncbi:MAG: LON peptidase substrate-binding domain-containing protein, partial [Bdellovibrionales bacterium]
MSFDDKVNEIPQTLPLLPVRDIVVFPYMIIPLFVGRESSIRAVEEALAKNRLIFLSSQKDFGEENPTPESIYSVGTVAMIMRMKRLSDGRVKVLIQGVSKAKVTSYSKTNPYFEVAIDKLEDAQTTTPATEVEALIRTTKDSIEKIIANGKPLSPDILLVLDDITDCGRIADLIASNIGVKTTEAQRILEILDPRERLKAVNEILLVEIENLQSQNKNKTQKDDLSKSQREYFLREQMKQIKSELGEGDSKSEEMEELRNKISNVGMPPNVETEALKQLARLERMHPDASEATMVRTYLDWMVDLPWSKQSEDIIDLKKSKDILDDDHYELQKAKDRILEFLAVRKLKSNMKGPILCFAGPPGVGKTSLGKSIAKAMGREYFRIALGGVKDEAEIRG